MEFVGVKVRYGTRVGSRRRQGGISRDGQALGIHLVLRQAKGILIDWRGAFASASRGQYSKQEAVYGSNDRWHCRLHTYIQLYVQFVSGMSNAKISVIGINS